MAVGLPAYCEIMLYYLKLLCSKKQLDTYVLKPCLYYI